MASFPLRSSPQRWVVLLLLLLTLAYAAPAHAAESQKIQTANYRVEIGDAGFRWRVIRRGQAALPPAKGAGLRFLGSPALSHERIDTKDGTITYRVTNDAGQTARVRILTKPHTLELTVMLDDGQRGDISLRTGSPGPAFGLGDTGSFGPNANLGHQQKTYPLLHDGHRHRWLSSFLVFPRAKAAGVFFNRSGGSVAIGPDYHEQTSKNVRQQTFYYFIGAMPEIYAAYRDVRIAEGYPGVPPKMDGFELGFETWDLLKWKTSDRTVRAAIEGYLDRGYDLRWAVTGSGFWEDGGTTVQFGHFHPEKFPSSDGKRPNLGVWLALKHIRWMIGQRVNFVVPGGPHHSGKIGESGTRTFQTSPATQEGIDKGYFLRDPAGGLVQLTSTVFPTVPCHLLDGNIPGAAEWFLDLYNRWGVDGVKEDTMMKSPDHTIYNAPMRAIAASGDLVMARCGAYSSPGTLTRVNDTFGARSMTLRCPINYLQYAASAAPNVYSDTIGFGGMGDPAAALRHAWFLALTAGLAVSDSPWAHGWSAGDEATFKKAVDFHHRLAPYLHSAAIDSHTTGYPHTMTPLPIAFPDDAHTYDLASADQRQFEWMIGPSLLAAPLLHTGYKTSDKMTLYLPEGKWIDYETGDLYQGPKTLENFTMPLDKTSVFVGGKGVVVERVANGRALQAVVWPIATDGSSYTFTHPDGESTSLIQNLNRGWDPTTLRVIDATTGATVPFTPDQPTGAIAFDLEPGHNYTLSGGE